MIITDFEGTCQEPKIPGFIPEIIEIGANNLHHFSEYRSLIRPIINPILSDFCIGLTGITQDQVNSARNFESVYAEFINFSQGELIFASWGNWDKKILVQHCERFSIPICFKYFLNIKQLLKDTLKKEGNFSLKNCAEYLGIPYVNFHRALGDSRIILNSLREVYGTDIYNSSWIVEISKTKAFHLIGKN